MTGWTPVTSGWCETAAKAWLHRRKARWEGPLTPTGGNLWCGECRREHEKRLKAAAEFARAEGFASEGGLA